MKNFTIDDFNDMVSFLLYHKYNIKIEDIDSAQQKLGRITGNGIKGFICLDLNYKNKYPYNIIACDNKNCFDKFSNCPLKLKLPTNQEILLKYLKWLGTKDGYEYARYPASYNNNILPMEF